MDTSPNTRPNVMDETTNSHVNIDGKEIELLLIASIETLKRQSKKWGKEEVFALGKDSLEEAITMASFEKSLALLQASSSIKCTTISNGTCLSIPKHSLIPKVRTQNTSSTKTILKKRKRKRRNGTFYEPTKIIIFYRKEFI